MEAAALPEEGVPSLPSSLSSLNDDGHLGADDAVWNRVVAEETETAGGAPLLEGEMEQARPPAVLRPFVAGVESDTQLERLHLADEAPASAKPEPPG
jgi:hypothetical protein